METIKNYLDNMFKGLPDTPEVRKAKTELLANMEDKYQQLKADEKTENEAIGIVISEFGNIDELINELNLPVHEDTKSGIYVSPDQASDFIKKNIRSARLIALGVFLCINCAVPLIFLTGMSEEGVIRLTENTASAIGLVSLFCSIAIAVTLFILTGFRLEKYKYISEASTAINLDYSTQKEIQIKRENYRPAFAAKISIGVILCITCCLPVIITGLLYEHIETYAIMAVCLLFLMVSLGVFLFITAGMKLNAYKALLQEKDYIAERKGNKLIDTIASIYWPLVTCIYLAWSFFTFHWGITWIIWPVAGILFGAIAAICNVINPTED